MTAKSEKTKAKWTALCNAKKRGATARKNRRRAADKNTIAAVRQKRD